MSCRSRTIPSRMDRGGSEKKVADAGLQQSGCSGSISTASTLEDRGHVSGMSGATITGFTGRLPLLTPSILTGDTSFPNSTTVARNEGPRFAEG